MVTKKTTSKTNLTLIHKERSGQLREVTVKVGPRERAFILEHIKQITYDVSNDILTISLPKKTRGKTHHTLHSVLYKLLVKKTTKRVKRADKNDYRVESFKI